MFAFPAAKRIRRADLYSPPTSPEPTDHDSELTAALLHSQLEQIYGPSSISLTNVSLSLPQQQQEETLPSAALSAKTIITATAADPGADVAPAAPNRALNADPEELGFEFRLFAAPRALNTDDTHDSNGAQKQKTATTRRIILDADEDCNISGVGDRKNQGGFVVPRRDEAYYFTGAREPMRRRRRREFEGVAVSGEEVKQWLGVRYSGWEVQWRVRYVRDGKMIVDNGAPEGGKQPVAVTAVPLAAGLDPSRRGGIGGGEKRETEQQNKKKGKPGKKRRIILRVRKRKGDELAQKRLEEKKRKIQDEKEREVADREKRTRRNREKKVKKKIKEKAKKASAQSGGGLGTGKDGENSDSGK